MFLEKLFSRIVCVLLQSIYIVPMIYASFNRDVPLDFTFYVMWIIALFFCFTFYLAFWKGLIYSSQGFKMK